MCGEVDAARELQAKLHQKSEEAKRVRQEIERAKLDAQMLRLQLQVQGIAEESLIPMSMGTGGKTPRATDLKFLEHRRLLEWLAENCDLTSKSAFNVPDPEVNVGGHRALLGHMVQWCLKVPGSLRLSAPIEDEQELINILMKTRRGLLGEQLEAFADEWLLVTTDLVADNVATPALFLINKESQKAIVVSAWPNIFAEQPQAPPQVARFDPNAFFSQSPAQPMPPPLTVEPVAGQAEVIFKGRDDSVSTFHCPPEGGVLWTLDFGDGQEAVSRPMEDLGVSFCVEEQFTISGPFGFIEIADPPPGPIQRWVVSGLVALALDHGVRVHRTVPTPTTVHSSSEAEAGDETGRPKSGDHVEVKYKGNWLRGIIQDVQGEVAHVKCDVDESGLITVAPLDRVRLAELRPDGTETDLTKGFSKC